VEVPKWKSIYEPSELERFGYKPVVWKKPEDTLFMPRKTIIDTKAFITPKGIKIISTTDKGTRIGATVKPFETGISGRKIGISKYSEALRQKGKIIDLAGISEASNRFIIQGISRTRSIIPSERLFYGIVTSKEIPTKISDITAFESISSFRVGTRATTKTIVPYERKEISFKGRLFGETDYTKDIILSRIVGGEIGKPGKFGFKVEKTPEVTYFVSKGISKYVNIVEAKGIAMVVKKQIDEHISDMFAGFEKDVIPKETSFFGGRGLAQTEYPRLFEKPESTILTKPRRGFIIEDELETVSPFWEDTKPKPTRYPDLLISKSIKAEMTKDIILSTILISRGELKEKEKEDYGLLYVLGKRTDIKTIVGLKSESILDVRLKTKVDIVTKLKKETMLKQISKQIMITTPIPPVTPTITTILTPAKPIPPETPPPTLLWLRPKIPKKEPMGDKAYHVFVKYRQYKEGIKIGKDELKQVTRKPLLLEAAKAYGASIVGKTEKATFVLKRATQQPGKLPAGVDPWFKVKEQYYEKEPGVFIEKIGFRIDEPGEIRGISALGWVAPKNKRRSRKKVWSF